MLSREPHQRSIKLKSPFLPVLVLLLVVVQLIIPFKVWALLLTGFGGMLILGFLWAYSLKRRLSLEREVRFSWKQVGDRLQERVSLDNHGWAPGYWVEIDDHSDMREYDISSVIEVGSRHSQKWHTQGICNNRGLYTLGPVTLTSGDPFGIFEVTVDYDDSVNMMVSPQVVPLPEIEIASGGRVGQGRSIVKSLVQTVTSAGVREYAPGDSLRWLHWPTTARLGEPYIRVFDDEPASDWHILLDLDAEVQVGEGHLSTEEHGIILAASLVNQGLETGKTVGFVAQGDDLIWHPPDFGDAHLWSILRSLATAQLGDLSLTHLLERARTMFGPRTSLIIITANVSLDWLDSLELLRRNGIVPTILLLDPVSYGGVGDVETIHQLLLRSGIAHHIIKSDLLKQSEPKRESGLRWLISHNRPWDATTDKWEILKQKIVQGSRIWGLFLLFFIGMTAVLSDSVRGLESNLIWLMIFCGIVFGVFFARSQLSGRVVGLLGVIAGLEVAVLRIGRFGEPIRDVLVRSFELLPQLYPWLYESAEPPDILPLLESLLQMGERLNTLMIRTFDWFIHFVQGKPVYDPVAVALLWGFAVWVAVVWAIWFYIRHKNSLISMLPGTLLVAVSLAFVRQTSLYFTLMFGTICALIVITNFDFQENKWQRAKMRYAYDIQTNIVIAAIGLAIGLAAFATFIPSLSVERVTDIFQRMAGETREGEFASSLGLEPRPETPVPSILEAKRRGGLPNSRLIGSGPELSEEVVMVARLETIAGSSLVGDGVARPTLYLRSLSYDGYTGRGWVSRRTQEKEYKPGDLLSNPERAHTYQVRQQIQFVEDGDGIVYTVGEPLSLDHDFQAAWRVLDEQNDIYDLFGVLVSEEIYRADSLVSVYTEDKLRVTGQEYPDWVRDRFLQLPDGLPERIYALARDLTATEPNPYDRAVALENYLRTIPYTLDVDTGPPNQDIVDYFLFDLKKGYCDYYASAMVVLARAAGLPARYVTGYVGETFDEINQVYVITADQAHAWTEVYFPGYGWIPFEPTSGRGVIDRQSEPSAELPEDFEVDLSPLVDESPSVFRNWPFVVGFSIALIFLVVIVGWIFSEIWLYLTPAGVLPEKIYERLYKISSRIGIRLQPGETAYEFTGKLKGYLDILSKGSRWSAWMRMSKVSIDRLTGIFVGYLFRTPVDDQIDKKELIRVYKNIRRLMWYLWVLTKLYHLKWLRPMLGINVQQFVGAVQDDLDRSKRKQKSGQIALS